MKTIERNGAAMRIAIPCIAALLLSHAPSIWAQQKAAAVQKQLVGVWRLVSDTNKSPDGSIRTAFGPNPKGEFIFTTTGHYASINTRADIPKFASGNRTQGTADENKAVVQGSIAHFGTYSISPDGKVLLLKVEGGTWPSWIGTEQKRDLSISGDSLKYTVAASIGGTSELTYKRVK
jgi:hypothetical protein